MKGKNLYIHWQPADVNHPYTAPVTGYRIEYRTVGKWAPLAEVDSQPTWYNWTTASYSAKYRFHIFALASGGLISEPSEEMQYETKGGSNNVLELCVCNLVHNFKYKQKFVFHATSSLDGSKAVRLPLDTLCCQQC